MQALLLRANLLQHDLIQRPKGGAGGGTGGGGGGRGGMVERMGFAAEQRGFMDRAMMRELV